MGLSAEFGELVVRLNQRSYPPLAVTHRTLTWHFSLLDDQGIDILDMDCQRVFIAGGGGVSSSLFTAQIALRLPREVQIDDIAKELESLSEDTRVIVQP